MKRRFDPKRRRIAKSYTLYHRILGLIHILISIALLLVFLLTGLSAGLEAWIKTFTQSQFLIIAIYLIVMVFGFFVVLLPLDFYSGFVIEHRFRLSKQSFFEWLLKQGKALGLSTCISLGLIEALYFFIRTFGRGWWIPGFLLYLGFGVLLTHLAPIILIPLFYRLTPIQDEDLRKRLINRSSEANILISKVSRMDLGKETRKANAGLTGLGRTKSIILSDTLLNTYSADEIDVVFSHELGHERFRHIWKLIGIEAALALIAFIITKVGLEWAVGKGYFAMTSISNLPLLLILFFSVFLIATPIRNFLSRHFEYEADKYAISITGNPDAFISSMIGLSDQNLSDINPPRLIEFLFYSHPSTLRRIRLAQEMKSAKVLS
jgi:STE24 endopeptidase